MADEPEIGELDITDELIAERRAEDPGQTPEDMTPWQRPITAFIDVLNLWVGRLICLLIIPMIFVTVYEVFSRTGFGFLVANGMDEQAREWGFGPTLWVYDVSRMLGGVFFMAAAGYALMRGVHIRADFIYRNWSPKTQATVDASLYLLFYFPAMLFFFWSATGFTLDSLGWRGWDRDWGQWEQAMDTTWAPILWPARIFMPIGAFLLFLQGFPELFRAFHQMGKRREAVFLKIFWPYLILLAILFYLVFFQADLAKDGARALRREQDLSLMQNFAMWAQGGLDWFAGLFGDVRFDKPTIGLFMLGAMLFSIFVGFPISFTLIFLGFVFGTWGTNSDLTFYLLTLQTNSVMLSDQLVAVPLFIFMGIMMEQAGLMERLFNAVQLMMSRVKGALYIAVLFVSTIFAAATGIVGASVTILGIMAAKTMNRSGYNVQLSAGAITAGGTLGILIPPSIMLIVMGPVLEVPVTDLFRAAIIPGVMLASLYLLYALGRCWLNPSLGPILPEDEQPETSDYYGLEVCLVLLATIMLFALIMMSAAGAFTGLFPFAALAIPIGWLVLMFICFKSPALTKLVATILVPVALLGSIIGLVGNLGISLPVPSLSISMFGLYWPSLIAQLVVIGFLAYTTLKLFQIYSRSGTFYFSDLWYEFFMGLVPPTVLIAFALGSILAGWATPAEAAACGAFGSILLSLCYRKLSISGFYDSCIKTLEITVLIMFLVAASNFFGAVFSNLGTPKMLTELLLSLDMSAWATLFLIMALIFLLGWPLEWVPIVLIIVPILLPVVETLGPAFGLDRTELLVWFAILVAVNLQTAWLSPPVALSAYFLKGVAPEWDLKDIYLGMMQFMVIQVIGLALIFLFPQIALWLPKFLDGG